jgi:hypothetical protein
LSSNVGVVQREPNDGDDNEENSDGEEQYELDLPKCGVRCPRNYTYNVSQDGYT